MTRAASLPPLAPQAAVSAAYVRLLFEELAARGVDATALLGIERPVGGAMDEPRYPMTAWRELLQRTARHLGDPLLGLQVGQRMTPTHLGLLGYLILACGTLGAALQRYERYERLFYDANGVHTAVDGSGVVLEWGTELGAPGALVDECALASLVQIARDVTGRPDLRCESLAFVNPAPPRREPYESWFGCAVSFDAPATRLRLPLAALALPLRSPDPLLLEMMERQAGEHLQRIETADGFERSVRGRITRLLREGTPDVDSVAAGLHTTTRTLHRRLAERGWNYQRLLADTRHRLAEDYLANPRLRLAEIALLLGYSEQSAFNRAYRQWTGRTPLQARRATRA